MKIKEVETIVGITRKNIRYYEEEGLLSPNRNMNNGYREYSEENIRTLQIIKLLRKLNVSIENIRRIQNGELSLKEAMEKQAEELSKKQEEIEHAKQICHLVGNNNDNLNSLDVDNYLKKIDHFEQQGLNFFDIANDFKNYVQGLNEQLLIFRPNKEITNEHDFTNELIQYCSAGNWEYDIKKAGMNPIIEINGNIYHSHLSQDIALAQTVQLWKDDKDFLSADITGLSAKRKRIFNIILIILVVLLCIFLGMHYIIIPF